ncbi:VOC family protein [Yinghuangia seranimata]|uniref:VOC family protein n=1 Tax=Yinghuangia seranimata TaxID=408067 RepID=UPI00248D376A|nr:VOC family protein [Yinghuangia seranimata]MDI2128502.1 VOC family protein [Yinghuangia seranimata]
MILGFSHIQLVVRDVEASAAFYRAVLGLDDLASGVLESGPYAALRHPTAGFVIGMQTAGPGDAAATPGIDHLSFAVSDLAALERLRGGFVEAGLAPGEVFEESVSHNLRLTDPDGLVVELTAPKGR